MDEISETEEPKLHTAESGKTCASCRYYDGYPDSDGACHRHAPRSRDCHAFSQAAMLQAIAWGLIRTVNETSIQQAIGAGHLDPMLFQEVTEHFHGDPWPTVSGFDWCGDWAERDG